MKEKMRTAISGLVLRGAQFPRGHTEDWVKATTKWRIFFPPYSLLTKSPETVHYFEKRKLNFSVLSTFDASQWTV